MTVKCENCGTSFFVLNSLAGKRVKCRRCGQGVFVGDSSLAAASPVSQSEALRESSVRKDNIGAEVNPGVEQSSVEEKRDVEKKIGEERGNAEKNEEDGRRAADEGTNEAKHVDEQRGAGENGMRQVTGMPPCHFCVKCGKPLEASARFCVFCGHENRFYVPVNAMDRLSADQLKEKSNWGHVYLVLVALVVIGFLGMIVLLCCLQLGAALDCLGSMRGHRQYSPLQIQECSLDEEDPFCKEDPFHEDKYRRSYKDKSRSQWRQYEELRSRDPFRIMP